jgi:O-antigen/teichoic acid export membrane protein
MDQAEHNSKRIAKNTLYLYLRMFIILIVSLFTVRIVIQTLGIEDYGVYNVVGGVVLALSFISKILSGASQRFFSYALGRNDKKQLEEVFTTISLCYFAVTILIVLLAESIGLWFVCNKMAIPNGRMVAALWVFQFAILSFVVSLLTNPYQAVIVSHENMSVYAYISIIEVVSKLLIVYLLLLLPYDKLKVYSILMFFTTLMVNSIYFLYCRHKYEESRFHFSWNKQQFISVFSYSSWTLFGTIAGQCNTQGVNILLNLFFGPVANAAYSIGSQVSNHVQGFGLNFYTAVKPPLIKSYAQGDYEYMNKLFVFSSKALFVLLYFFILPIFVVTYDLLFFWLGKVEMYMVDFVRLFLIYTLLLSISFPITALIQAAGRVKIYHTLVDGFSLISLPTIYILFKLGFPANTCFYVTIFVFLIAHFIRLLVAKKVIYNFSIMGYLKHIGFPILIAVVLTLLPMLIVSSYFDKGIVGIIILVPISLFICIVTCYYVVFDIIERKQLIRLIRNKIKI